MAMLKVIFKCMRNCRHRHTHNQKSTQVARMNQREGSVRAEIIYVEGRCTSCQGSSHGVHTQVFNLQASIDIGREEGSETHTLVWPMHVSGHAHAPKYLPPVLNEFLEDQLWCCLSRNSYLAFKSVFVLC